ncbi:hypothetical protein GCM10011415_02010 [Salipiger pallidus]|uniref:Uncharacterized protein n=1 Tax=Salipiger pallidus TaxID=1775170 RepID=A0A8J2ZGG7_9RHOB|nr:hypothetical protein [Salipiger pallidus]GGG59698.1 hypothetical protein GCM10011415_02010 [Salipiger pallidus]
MNIILSPVRLDTQLELFKSGDTLTINGEAFDFSALPAGATLPRAAINCDWIAGDVTRDEAGVLTVPVVLPHGGNAPEETCFPEPLVDVPDGPVELPPYNTEEILE